jgi:glutamyl-tRNA synthetase
MRLAVTGQKVSPPLFESMLAMGRERVLDRLDQAIQLLLTG